MAIAGFIRTIALLMPILAIATCAVAGQALFTIKSASSGKSYEVTEDVLTRIGTTSYKTTLPGMDYTEHEIRGPLVRDLLKAAGIEGQTAVAVALDKYEIEIPTSDFTEFDVIVAVELDGRRLSVREKGPAWIAYPVSDNPGLLKDPVYEARSIWQLKELTIK